MKRFAFAVFLALLALAGYAQNSRIKNVILFIPDGTSVDVLSLARWYSGNKPLSVDEIVCGLVRTYSADSTIADSAPAGTAYATGTKSTTGFVGVNRDSLPNISVLELARLKGKSTGVVVTCEFPHATPADFVCHYPGRSYSSNDLLIKQFVYNSPSLVFAGGGYYLNNYLKKSYSLKDTLESRGFSVVTDIDGFRKNNRENVWALFSDWNHQEKFMSHDIDRDPATEPSLSEMTQKAISILSKNPKGFFLMVEGSQVDWSSHVNEPAGLATDFLAFDKAVGIGLKFAKANDSTLVVVCPDHGNGGISIGNIQSGYSPTVPFEKIEYDNLNIAEKIAKPLAAISWTGRKMAQKIINDSTRYVIDKSFSLSDTLALRYNLRLPADSLATIESIVRAKKLSADSKRDKLEKWLAARYSEQHFIGWTTTGHTGEDVFLGVYAPKGANRLTGVVENTGVSEYIAKMAGLGDLNADENYFYRVGANSTEFPGFKPSVQGTDLVFEHRSNDPKKRITVPSNTDYYFVGTKKVKSNTLLVNIGGNFYIPKELAGRLNSGN
jgi:alkaline phosphatase